MLTQVYEDEDTVSYRYDNDGALAAIVDSATGRTTTRYYDLIGRLMRYVEQGENYSHSVTYTYNEDNNLSQTVEVINGVSRTTLYTYDDDDRVTAVTADGTTVEYVYDSFGRITQQVTKRGSTVVLTESFTYTSPSSTTTSSQIATYTTTTPGGYSLTYTYTYDDNGNILTVNDGTNTTSYVYDSANQLTRENNQAGNYTQIWTYDNAGNITSRNKYAYTTAEDLTGLTSTGGGSYAYGDDSWGDLLTSYDGQTISHDEIGNPLNDGTWTYDWEHGRQLKSMSNSTTTWDYAYNADGMRTKRTKGTTTYEYIYNGSQLTRITINNLAFDIAYDAAGKPLTITVSNYTYYYVTNLQGDVVAILDAEGNVVGTYTYDAWGNCIAVCEEPIADHNPLRYRGYVYDQETGLYYLQSRYYDPEIGRFINADGLTSTGQGFCGNNVFAYCNNNPGNCLDSSGMRSVPATHRLDATGKTNVGAAPDYVDIEESDGDRNTNPNCYSYVAGYYDRSYDPGDFSSGLSEYTLDGVEAALYADMAAKNRGCRPLDTWCSVINENEYRIALNVSEVEPVFALGFILIGYKWDYHFMIQTSSGKWAEKNGPEGPTILHECGNPSTISWDHSGRGGFDYGDDIRYYALTQ